MEKNKHDFITKEFNHYCSVAEPQHFYEAPALGLDKYFDTDPALDPTVFYTNKTYF
jgi:hypothetical protein